MHIGNVAIAILMISALAGSLYGTVFLLEKQRRKAVFNYGLTLVAIIGVMVTITITHSI